MLTTAAVSAPTMIPLTYHCVPSETNSTKEPSLIPAPSVIVITSPVPPRACPPWVTAPAATRVVTNPTI